MKSLFSFLFLVTIHVSFAQWQLVWQDEFNYTGLPDANKWGYDTGAGGWGNNELQNYTTNRTENARVENGTLVLEARRDWYGGSEYSSARMVTRNKGDWKYGRIEVRAKVPLGQGLWPAIWMLPTDWVYGGWPASGEIDIMENFALGGIKPNQIEGNVHTQSYNHTIGTNKGAAIHNLSNIEDNYHVYAVSWYDNKIDFEVDGQIYFTFNNEGNWQAWPYDQRFHLILNIAVGGTLGTTPDPNIFPKRMTVDYVRVYEQHTGPSSTTGVVTAYKDCDYQGFSTGMGVGNYNMAKLIELGMGNDQISSLKISEGYEAILYQDDNFTGSTTVINSDNNCLNTTWNNKVTSIKVIPKSTPNLAGTYYLQNRESGLYMDAAGGEVATDDGINIHQWSYTGTKNQQFKFSPLTNGAYAISIEHSGKVIDIDGIKTNAGANLQQWTNYGSGNQKFIIVPTENGFYKLIAMHSGKVIEVKDASHDNQANVQQWDNNNQLCGQWKFIPTNAVTGTGSGLRANYFNGKAFDTPVLTRIDEKIDFNWTSGSPGNAVNNDNYSARWTGEIQAKYDGDYTFYLDADDGRKLWIDGDLIIDNWSAGSYQSTGNKTLVAGQKYDIRIDYYEGGGNAKSRLYWSTNTLAKEIVPKTQLYPNTLPTVNITSPLSNSSHVAPATITITANANDSDGSVEKVVFYEGTNILGEDNSAPYTYEWNNVFANDYTISARVYDNLGAVQHTPDDLQISVSGITGLDYTHNLDGTLFYPNPTQGVINISHKSGIIEVYNMEGTRVLKKELSGQTVDLSSLDTGIYVLHFKLNEEVIVSKLIKQ